MRAMGSRKLLRDAIARRPVSRIPLAEICYWPETIERWEREGLPAGCDPLRHFGLDAIGLYGPDLSPRLPVRTLAEDNATVTRSDEWGRTVQSWKNTTATPVNLRFAVDDLSQLETWLERYATLDHRIIDESQLREHERRREAGDFTAVTPMEPAWFVIEYLLGFEEGLMAFVTHPDLVRRALRVFTDYTLRHLSWLIDERGVTFDALWFFADLCFKNGMLLPPAVYREHVLPLHREFRRFCDERGLAFMLHCDGDVRGFIPLVIEAGFDVIQPLEARVGNDVRELKRLWGDRITFMGNINADLIARGTPDEIRTEVTTKLKAAMEGGGYIYHIDHSVPPTVPLANYRLLVELLKEHGAYR